jgi:hypothetical protein
MKSLAIAACCGFALSVTGGLAQAQTRHTSVPAADANATGNVTLPEYQASRETFIMKADTNHDGMVSRAEWDAFAHDVRRDLDLNGVKGAERIGQGAWWTALDANHDGMVTHAEISALTATKFAEYDTDGNHMISRAEAQQARKTAEAALNN